MRFGTTLLQQKHADPLGAVKPAQLWSEECYNSGQHLWRKQAESGKQKAESGKRKAESGRKSRIVNWQLYA